MISNVGLCNLLKAHLKTPSCGRGWKMCLPKAEKSIPDAETSSAWQGGLVPVLLSSRTCFGISVLGLEIWVLKPRPVGGVLYCFVPSPMVCKISSPRCLFIKGNGRFRQGNHSQISYKIETSSSPSYYDPTSSLLFQPLWYQGECIYWQESKILAII